jgi:hypothetical protein
MYRVVNDSSLTIHYKQVGSKRQHVLRSGQSQTLGWDEPARLPHVIVRVEDDQDTISTFDMNRVGLQADMKCKSGRISARTEADGPTLVLHVRDVLSDTEWIVLEKGRRRRTRRRRRRSTKIELEKELGVHNNMIEASEKSKMSLNMIFTLDLGIGVSAVDESCVEIAYASLRNFRFAYNRTSTLESCGIVIGDLQLDSHLQDTPFPVVVRIFEREVCESISFPFSLYLSSTLTHTTQHSFDSLNPQIRFEEIDNEKTKRR